MDIGVIRVAEDSDFEQLKRLIDNDEGWKLDYTKDKTNVWTKSASNTDFKMVKISTIFPDVPPQQMYDVLHDPEYRKVWDTHMIDARDIGYLNPNNDVGYYSMSCPPPLKNRDFVLQRSWLDTGVEQLIVNHSVYHKDYPPNSTYVRAISHITGFVIRPDSGSDGCSLGYVSQTDPKGTLPPWLVNRVTQILAPKMVKNLHRASQGYDSWKRLHNPNLKPWHFPEQLTSPRITIQDCVPVEVEVSIETVTATPSSPKNKTKKEKKLSGMAKVLRKR